jgi:hypothetical protein
MVFKIEVFLHNLIRPKVFVHMTDKDEVRQKLARLFAAIVDVNFDESVVDLEAFTSFILLE